VILKTKPATKEARIIDFLIIGGGPSGMSCAIALKRKYYQSRITILEKATLGRKIKVSGNGRCNIGHLISSNTQVYNDYDYQLKLLSPANQVLYQQFLLETLNLITRNDNGLLYPYSKESQTVLDSYLKCLSFFHINIVYEEVTQILEEENAIFEVVTTQNHYLARKVILAMGSPAYQTTNQYSFLAPYFQAKKIQMKEFLPGLSGYQISTNISQLNGLRLTAKVSLVKSEVVIFSEVGEVQFKADGISGIVIMNSSNTYQRLLNKKNTKVRLDLIYDLDNKLSLEAIINSLDKKLIAYLTKNYLTINRYLLQNWELSIKDTYDFSAAQIAIGGICLDEISDSYEFKKIKGLYAIGELLDVDGLCGGYNLMHAILSGLILAAKV
jgi:predicted Rossmann fold flavoprotein